MRLIGLDPGLRHTGWGIIDCSSGHISHIGHGVAISDPQKNLATRLRQLYEALTTVLEDYKPEVAAVEETFVNMNPASTLKLGQARAMAVLAPAMIGIPVFEYPPNLIKKSIVGAGHAQKQQVAMMVNVLLPKAGGVEGDAADALAVAICHYHFQEVESRILPIEGGSP